eukprot:CAMPEP_0172926036 /NCGR_PEP_ID=MMETSP1075-20121228/214863_1 /TAXON_ID=2916 /ORGANISM="Ceratium fusus, Strain PA161109" /LENGTH=60 /DNA_ID=CAMNT_0013787023 /DNA_START=212 /DNA_END=394 /DNA_ORIENTATION=-
MVKDPPRWDTACICWAHAHAAGCPPHMLLDIGTDQCSHHGFKLRVHMRQRAKFWEKPSTT